VKASVLCPAHDHGHTPFLRPFMPITSAVIVGILAGIAAPGWLWWAVAALIGLAAAIVWCAWRRRPLVVVPLLFCAVGGYLSIQPWLGRDLPAGHVRHSVDEGKWRVIGRIVDAPQVRGDRLRFVLAARELRQGERSLRVTGRVQVTARAPFPELWRGDTVALSGHLRDIHNFCNPGGFDYERYMALRGIHCRLYAQGESVRRVASDPGLWAARIDRFRAWVAAKMAAALQGHPDAVSAVIQALALGDRKGITDELRTAFNRAGVSHVLAISGLHIGMVAAAALFILRALLVRIPVVVRSAWVFKGAAALSLLPVVFYGLLSGFSPSTQRAVIMTAFFLGGFWVGRPYNWPNVFAVAALAILVYRPPALLSISFQLSFAAVWAILLGVKALPFLIQGSDQSFWRRWGARSAGLAWVSILAMIGTLPLVMRYFNLVSWVGPVSNLCIVPLVGTVVVPAALAGVLCAPLSATAAAFSWQIAAWGVRAILWFVENISQFEAVAWVSVTPTVVEIVLFYLFFALLFFWKRIHFRWVAMGVVLMATVADGVYWHHRRYDPERMVVTALDVGQGSANLLQLPGGFTVLVDGGGFSDSSVFDVGRSIVAPLLWHHKIKRVDLIILSHPDSDHLNGLLYILRHFDVKEIWSNHEAAPTEGYRQWQEIIAQRRLVHTAFERLPRSSVRAGVSFEILGPPADFAARPAGVRRGGSNNHSLVVRIAWGDTSFLFPGDIEKAAEADLVARYGAERLGSTILLMPHHGSRNSSSEGFLRAVGPREAIASAGWHNPFHFPHPQVIERYRQAGCRLWRTDHCGAIQITLEGKAYRVQSCRSDCP